MKTIIIAAGYATRLYPLTENFPKPLLQIGSSSILGRLIADIDTISDIDEHIIVSNHKFAHHFESWRQTVTTRCPIRIIDDGTSSNETRLGAVRDLLLAIQDIDDDLLVVAADNILDFSLAGFVTFAKQQATSCLMCYFEPEVYKLQRTGVIRTDKQMQVLEMQEKPEVPCSNWAVPPFYVYLKHDLPLIRTCIENGCGFDAPGNLAHYLINRTRVYAYVMPGTRFDIGSLDTYKEAQIKYGNV